MARRLPAIDAASSLGMVRPPDRAEPAAPPMWPWRLATLCALALAVRLHALGRASLWFDELLEVERASGPWRALFLGRSIDHDPPLLALALRVWIILGGQFGWPWMDASSGATQGALNVAARDGWAEAWLRLPAVALGVAAVALTAVWATRWFGRRVGLLAALLLALSPLAIYHSQEVNQYAAMIAATPLLLLLHERVTGRSTARDWLAYAAVAAAALATHYGLVFPLLALGIDLAWRAWRDPARRADRGRVVAYALWCAAVVGGLFALGLGPRMALPHVQPRLWGTHLAKELAYIGDVGWREIIVFFPFPFAGGPAIAVANGLGMLALVGAVRLWRGGDRGRGRLLVGGCVGGTLVATYLTSLVGWYPLGYRYGLFNLVPYVVLVAAGIEGLGAMLGGSRLVGPGSHALVRVCRRVLAAAACGALVAFWPHAPWTAANPYIDVPREDVRPVLQTVAAAWRAGDRLAVYDGAAPAVRFYWRGDPADVVALPPFTPSDADAVARVRTALGTALGDVRGAGWAVSGDPFGRAWLVVSHIDPGDEAVLRQLVIDHNASPRNIHNSDGAAVWRIEPYPVGD